ncbi:MAG: hypothetical protein BGN83_20245 [Rhizobium sp. 63-7]|nr:MAG: hypothetical protein BGN83_20245 [Rhizobium sp. 63-7]
MPKINWKTAPKGARWWAMDADGRAYWYCAPNVAAFTHFWFAEPIPAPTFDFSGDWRQSLVERPYGKGPQGKKLLNN